MRRWAKSVQRNVVGDPVRPVRPHKILLDAQTIHGTIQSSGSQHQHRPKELVPFTQLVKVRRGKLVLALPSIRFS